MPKIEYNPVAKQKLQLFFDPNNDIKEAVDTDAVIMKDTSGNKKWSIKHNTNIVKYDHFSPEPDNKLLNSGFETDLSNWTVTAPTSLTNANGEWILVPADAGLGTSPFFVMKYEAKYDANGDGDGDTPAQANAVGQCTGATVCAADSGLGFDYRDIVTKNKEKVISTANGAPLVLISQTQAIAFSPTGYHLITNAEWMAIARNIELVSANWANGAVGSLISAGGGLKRGNVGNLDSVGYDGTDPEYGTGRNAKAQLTLSNGESIWDLSGNVWEWTNDTITGANQPDVTGQTGFNWREFTALTSYGSLTYDAYRPLGSTYDATYGVGRIYHSSDSAVATVYAFRRGGDWGDTSYAGAFAAHLNGTPGNAGVDIGFRCASDPVDISHSFSSSIKYAGNQSLKLINTSPSDTTVLQSVNVGDTSTYTLIAYAYTTGAAVTTADLNLYYDTAVISTTFTDMGSGWYKLTGTLTGVASAKNYGVKVKAGKTVYLDTVSLQAGSGATIEVTFENSSSGTSNYTFENNLVANGVTTVNGSKNAVVSKSGNYTLTSLDNTVIFTASATASLPSATGSGQTYRIVCRAGTVTIDASGSETVVGELTQTLTAGENLIISDVESGKWE